MPKNFFEPTDVHMKPQGSKFTRNDILFDKLKRIEEKLDKSHSIITTVYDGDELVESTKGGIENTKTVIEYYSENFILDISRKSSHEVIVRIKGPLKEAIQVDEE